MKKKLLIIGLCLSCIVSVCSLTVSGAETSSENSKNKQSVSSKQFESGKWVGVYEGGSSPVKCVCVESWLDSECLVGDISKNLSLCE